MNELLRAIPKVTELYDLPEVSDLREHYASSSVTEWIRTVLEQLRSAFSRDGFTDGYFLGQTGPEMFGTRQDEADPHAGGVGRPDLPGGGTGVPAVSAAGHQRHRRHSPYQSGPWLPV